MAQITIPASPNFKHTPIDNIFGAGISISPWTGQIQSQGTFLQQMGFTGELPLMLRAVADPWIAFFQRLEGSINTFLWGPTYAATAKGDATGTPLTNGIATIRSNTLVTDGWTTGQTDILKAGDLIQISDQLYNIRQDENSDGSGNATFDIWPPLRQAYADDTPLTVSSPQGEWVIADVRFNYPIDTSYRIGPITFTAIEKIP